MTPENTSTTELFLLESWETLEQLDSLLETPALQQDAPVLVHRLDGSARLQGFDGVSERALALGRSIDGLSEVTPQTAMQELVSTLADYTLGTRERNRQPLSEHSVDADVTESVPETPDAEDTKAAPETEAGGSTSNIKTASALSDEADKDATLEVAHTQTAEGEAVETEAAETEPSRQAAAADLAADSGADVADAEPQQATETSLERALKGFFAGDTELVEGFRAEIGELLDRVESVLRQSFSPSAESEGETTADDAVASLFRYFHTIKGSALVVGCEPLGELAHVVEDHLDRVRGGKVSLDRPLVLEAHRIARAMLWFDQSPVRGLETALRTIEDHASAPKKSAKKSRLSPSRLEPIETSRSASEAEAQTVPRREVRTVRTDVDRVDRIINGLSQISAQRTDFERTISSLADLRSQVDISQTRVKRFARSLERSIESVQQANPDRRPAAPSDFGVGEFDDQDDFGLLSRQIAEIADDLKTLGENLTGDLSTLRNRHGRLQRVTSDLRLEIGRLRMIPMSQVFARLQRSFDSAVPEGIQVDLELTGESAEVDSAVFEAMFEALEHVLVNALVHGVEPPEERKRLGKPERAKIIISATQQRDTVGIEIRDDGRGVNLARLAERALQLGLKSSEDLEAMPEERRWELMLLPGLSTNRTADIRSGRGVGMDIVVNRLRRIGGELQVETDPGQGTAFTFDLPLTLVVTDVLSVEAGGQQFAFPSRKVLKVLQQRALGPTSMGRSLTTDLGEMPVYALESLLAIPQLDSSENRGATVLLRSSRGSIAIEVDKVNRIEEVVLRSPGPFLDGLEYLLGGVMGNGGRAVLVLNPEAMLDMKEVKSKQVGERRKDPRILMVDDSPSVRRVVSERLRELGSTVVVARDGLEARDQLALSEFDLLLTDLEMPNMHGYDLIRSVRADSIDLPIVVMTTRVSQKHRDAAKELDVSRVVTKPASDAELSHIVSMAKESAR